MWSLPEDKRTKIVDNNREISRLLTENEKIIRESGYDPPRHNFVFNPQKENHLKIQVPTGYIRTKNYYMKKYGLLKICNGDDDKASNVAYNLQLSDFYNYIINRIGIYGPIFSMLSKQATINVVSIIEVLMKLNIETLQKKCAKCPYSSNCKGRISRKKAKPIKFQTLVSVYEEMDLLGFGSVRPYRYIKSIYDYRNRIHLAKARFNELKEDADSTKRYNSTIRCLLVVNNAMKKRMDAWSNDLECPGYNI